MCPHTFSWSRIQQVVRLVAVVGIGLADGFLLKDVLPSAGTCFQDGPSHRTMAVSLHLKQNGNPEQSSHKNRDDDSSSWELVSSLATVTSPWLTIRAERLKDDKGKLLDYWRVEKDDSAVIVTIHQGYFVLPKPSYRPGVARATLDFPGGRIPKFDDKDDDDEGNSVVSRIERRRQDAASEIVQRELGVLKTDNRLEEDVFVDFYPTHGKEGYAINSSFSDQRLYGYVAILRDEVELDSDKLTLYKEFTATEQGAKDLLQILPCLQCRTVLLEWLQRN